MALVVNAQEAGKDVTSLFTNTDFETGDNSGWDAGDGIGHGHAATAANYGYQGTHFMEAWTPSTGTLGDFDWSQTVEVPNGYYLVKALAHAVKQGQGDNTPVSKGVYVYANDQRVEVKCTKESPDEYVVLAKATEGTLTIGYCAKDCNVNWVACDYFRVVQCEGDTEEAAKTSWVKFELNELAAAYEEISERFMSQALKDEIEASIAEIEGVSSFADADALWTKMKQQMVDAEECLVAYEKLSLKIDELYDFIDNKGADDLYDVADAASEKYENGELDAAGALAEIEAINDAIFEFNLQMADGSTGFDVTEMFVTNPTLREKNNKDGWEIVCEHNKGWSGSPAWGADLLEFWNCDFSVTQTLTDIPNGKYMLSVQAFYRASEMTAELFGNSDAVKLVPLSKYSTADFGSLAGGYTDQGLANDLTSASAVFNTYNPVTGRNFYDENELEVIVMDGTLTFGIRNKTTEGGAWCAMRDFRLSYYGNYPCVNLKGKISYIKDYIQSNLDLVPYAVNVELYQYMDEIYKYTVEQVYGDKDDEVNAVILELDTRWADAQKAMELYAELKALFDKGENELLPLDYPGKAELSAVLEEMLPYFDEASTVNTYANMQALKAEVEEAFFAYYTSQVATPEVGADYTFLLPNPNFEQKGDWTWSMAAGGSDLWAGNCRPTEDGGESRRGVNLWGWGITSVDVHQTLVGIPDGLYKVSAELITQTNYATDQHVYATGASKAISEALKVEGWDTYEWTELTTTDYAVVIGGQLIIGAEASQGGTNSEGWFQATNFKLFYHGEASEEQLKAAWEDTKARAEDALDILIPNEKKELAAAMEQALPLASAGKYSDACILVSPMITALDSTIKATQKFYGDYYGRLDTLRLRDGYENCDSTHLFADAVVAMVDEILSSDTATCKLFDGINSQLQAYAGYASSLRDAENAINDTVNQYLEKYEAFVADSVVRPQVEILLSSLCGVDYCNELRAVLDEAIGILKGTINISKEIAVGDVTYLIVNPTIDVKEGEELAGWTIAKNNAQNCGTNNNEHYSGATNTYLDAWHPSVGTMNATFSQEINGIPDGTYKLTVAARTDGGNAFVFAATAPAVADSTTQWVEVVNNGAWRGQIWADDSLAWVADGCPEEDLEVNYPYFMARPDSMGYGAGFGWSWHVIENIEVTNHILTIGLTAEKALSGKNFSGTWMGADDWKLELIKVNEVQSEFDPFANFNKDVEPEEKPEDKPEDDSVEMIEVSPMMQGIYDLYGRRLDAITAPGLYIVNGVKVVVK